MALQETPIDGLSSSGLGQHHSVPVLSRLRQAVHQSAANAEGLRRPEAASADVGTGSGRLSPANTWLGLRLFCLR